MFEYKINFRRQLIMLMPLTVTTLLGYAALYYYIGSDFFKLDFPLYVTTAFVLIFSIIPTLSIHINYFLKNRNSIFRFDRFKGDISYADDKINFIYSFTDIDRLERYSSYGASSTWYTWSAYRYFKFVLKDGNEIIITSLMLDIKGDLEQLIGIKAVDEMKLLALT